MLSDSLQAHPLLQGPEDYCKADSEVAIGPDYLLPKKKNESGSSITYEPFQYLDPPKGAAESIRTNKGDLRDEVDRAACLTRPSGVAGQGANSVAQSGISKQLDQSTGNNLLSRLASQLARAERLIAEYVLLVQNDRSPTPGELDQVRIIYPTEFDLYSAQDLAVVIGEYQSILAAAGETPDIEFQMLSRLVKLVLPGLDDKAYDAIDLELLERLKELASIRIARAPAPAKAGRASALVSEPAVPPAEPHLQKAGNSPAEKPALEDAKGTIRNIYAHSS